MQTKTRLLLLTLSLAVFGVITTEVAVIGLLPQLMAQLNITAPQVGFLVSIYAVVVAATGPFITLLFGKFNRKTVLLTIMALFIISNIVYALTHQYQVILLFRILPALTHALFFAIALIVAANSVPIEKSAHGVAIVFSGVAVGMVLGMPLSSFIAEAFSLSAAFWFGALTSIIAFVGIIFFVPSIKVTHPLKISEQLKVLTKSTVWLSISTVTLLFSAMFAGFSYIADYLVTITGFSNNITSTLLVVFGVSGYVGNFIFSHYLQRSAITTTLMYPILFSLVYFIVWLSGQHTLAMIPLVILWGILHTSGLIVCQSWLMRDAKEAPEFANSLYISFSNLGITIGSMVSAWVIQHMALHMIMWVGIIFSVLAFMTIWLRVRVCAKQLNVVYQSN